jgi:hypothetical protein
LKSHLFTDTQDFDSQWACPSDKICICLRLDRNFYFDLCSRAAGLNLTTGQYMEQTVKSWEALEKGPNNASTGIQSAQGMHPGPEN